MRISIYQIIPELDKQNLMFRDLRYIRTASGNEVPAELYESVYTEEVQAETLEDVFRIFNIEHPEGYKGRSLSVSDVVEVIHSPDSSKFFFCEPVGFTEVEFNKSRAMLPISNHDFDCVLEIRNQVHVYFIGNNGLECLTCEKIVLQRCSYSQSQLGYELQYWVYGDDHIRSRQFLSRPPLVITKYMAQFPRELLYEKVNEDCDRMRYPAHSEENLHIVRTWLAGKHQKFEEL